MRKCNNFKYIYAYLLSSDARNLAMMPRAYFWSFAQWRIADMNINLSSKFLLGPHSMLLNEVGKYDILLKFHHIV